MPSNKIRIAVVGAGGWGSQYCRILEHRKDAELVAIVGRDPSKLLRQAEHWGTRGYTDTDCMLAEQKPDLVILALPNLEHFAPAQHLLERGVPVILEKPLVFHMHEADALLELAQAKKVFFSTVFNHRYAQPIQLAKQAMAEGALGTLTFALWRFGGQWEPDHPHMTLIESFCHGFDMLEYLCGPIQSIMCEQTDLSGHGFRSVAIALRFASGAVGSMLGGYDSSFAYRDTHLLELNGTRARVLVEDTFRTFSLQKMGDETRSVWEAGYLNDRGRSFYQTLDAFMDLTLSAFGRGEPPPVPASCGRRALQLALAAIESFETGVRVRT